MGSLVVANVVVSQDAAGRFNLNDFHKAAGGESKDQPANWLRLDKTKDLVIAIENDVSLPQNRGVEKNQGLTCVNVVKGGTSPGTYVSKDLVYAYATWISPKFYLQVIRAYDAMVQGNVTQIPQAAQQPLLPVQVAKTTLVTYMEVMDLFNAPRHLVEIEAVKLTRRDTGVDFHPCLLHSPAQNNIPDEQMMLEPKPLGARLGISGVKMNRDLAALGLQYRGTDGNWYPTAKGRPLCINHSWNKEGKSGYNLKWNVAAIESLFSQKEAA